MKLKAAQVAAAKPRPGATSDVRLSDGGTLYLQIKPGGSKSWVQVLRVNRRRRVIGLARWPVLALKHSIDDLVGLAACAASMRVSGRAPGSAAHSRPIVSPTKSNAPVESAAFPGPRRNSIPPPTPASQRVARRRSLREAHLPQRAHEAKAERFFVEKLALVR